MNDGARFFAFIREREAIRVRKERGDSPPWTDDAILGAYRFCNVNPEDDRVTRWIRAHWSVPRSRSEYLWIALAAARYINWPDSLEAIGFPTSWDQSYCDRCVAVLNRRAELGLKAYTGAYMLRGNGSGKGGKASYTFNVVLRPMFESLRDRFLALDAGIRKASLELAHGWLTNCYGVGGFMADLIVSDLRHTRYLDRAEDINTWAFAGPGAVRGLNRLGGRPVSAPLSQDVARVEMRRLLELARAEVSLSAPWELHMIENCCCEWDKYERVRLGEGAPRSRYRAVPSATDQ